MTNYEVLKDYQAELAEMEAQKDLKDIVACSGNYRIKYCGDNAQYESFEDLCEMAAHTVYLDRIGVEYVAQRRTQEGIWEDLVV